MKKRLTSILCAFAFLFGSVGVITAIAPETTHSIVHAATAVWQCSKCGQQQRNGGSVPGMGSCPQGGKHVWQRVQ